MKKRFTKKVVILVGILLIVIVVLLIKKFSIEDSSKTDLNEEYYNNLREIYCEGLSDSEKGCCLGTIEVMQENRYFLAEDNSCPEGYEGPIIARCIGAVPFCVPEGNRDFFNPVAYSNLE